MERKSAQTLLILDGTVTILIGLGTLMIDFYYFAEGRGLFVIGALVQMGMDCLWVVPLFLSGFLLIASASFSFFSERGRWGLWLAGTLLQLLGWLLGWMIRRWVLGVILEGFCQLLLVLGVLGLLSCIITGIKRKRT